MITRREPRSRQQRPYSSQTMRTFSMPLYGITAIPFASGAADAAVANSAEAPSASEMIALFILNSCELNSCEVPNKPMVETTNRSSNSALNRFPGRWNDSSAPQSNPDKDEPFNPRDV